MPTSNPRFTVTFDKETLEKLNDYRADRKIWSQSEAVLRLVKIGLEAELAAEKASQQEDDDNVLVFRAALSQRGNTAPGYVKMSRADFEALCNDEGVDVLPK